MQLNFASELMIILTIILIIDWQLGILVDMAQYHQFPLVCENVQEKYL